MSRPNSGGANPFAATEKLVAALRTRGLAPHMSVRVGAHPSQLHEVATAIQDLLGLDRRATQQAITDRATVLADASPERAKDLALALQTAGAYAWIDHTRTERYAYPSAVTQRTDGSCEWLFLVGRDLFLARGRPWDWGAMELLVREGHTNVLLAAIDTQRARWAKTGLIEANDELALLVGRSARHLEFEAGLARAEGPELESLAAVYADWLQTQGDPRGEVGIAAAAVAGGTAGASATFERLLSSHAAHLLGPVHAALDAAALRWVGPVVVAARPGLNPTGRGPVSDPAALTEVLLGLPVCAVIRELVLDPLYAQAPTLGPTLARAACRLSVRRLTILEPHDLALEGDWPRLERLAIGASEGALEIGPSSMPALQRLALGLRRPTSPLVASVARIQAPAIEHLTLEFEAVGAWERVHGSLSEQLEPLMALPMFARLTRLTLACTAREPFDEGMIQRLRRLPCLDTLRRIDLRRANLSKRARVALDEARDKLPPVMSSGAPAS